ncbi:hypothetical protein [Streptomyces sp. IBSBF 3136]|uniref:hypothetical protein n=1 Tax=Streptomyces sp. IBSBF 3136 TaxID=2903524 RepID=UPI002FDC7186
MPQKKPLPPTYRKRLLEELDTIERDYLAVLEASEIQYVNPNRSSDSVFIVTTANFSFAATGGGAEWGCAP